MIVKIFLKYYFVQAKNILIYCQNIFTNDLKYFITDCVYSLYKE